MDLLAERSERAAATLRGGFAGVPEKRIMRILLVQDRPSSLERLTKAIARYGPAWRVDLASGFDAALAAVQDDPADIVICEERVSGLDASALLAGVRDMHPTTIRLVLAEPESFEKPTRATVVAHRLIPKSCPIDELGMLIERTCSLHGLIEQVEAYRMTVAATALPSSPTVYTELNEVLCDPQWGPNQVAEVIECDVAMSAKVLQVANSALFSLARQITSVREAVVYLGVDTIRSLALTVAAFDKLAPTGVSGFSIDEFQRHAVLVGRIAAAILPFGRVQQEAITAGLLHDIGKLLMICDTPVQWGQLNEQAQSRRVTMHEIERETYGVTHADIGAHLLSLWGLPDDIVEAVAHHHDPDAVPGFAFDAVAAVHIADALAHEAQPLPEDGPPPGTIDEAMLDTLGLRPRLDLWRQVAHQLTDAAFGGAGFRPSGR